MSFVRTDLPNSVGNGFYLKSIYSGIDTFGDSFFLQSPRTFIELSNSTPQTISYEACSRIMDRIASSINPNFDGLTRSSKSYTPVYVKVQSNFNDENLPSIKQMNHKEQIIQRYFDYFTENMDMIS